ncbi:MAG: hypothetical protein KF830_18415 [Planctomycetes bacterium]|nr:hypothetical protein [Planctomycetota bacterium]
MTAHDPRPSRHRLLAAGLLLAVTGTAQGPTWGSPSQLPDSRSHHAMAYDEARGRTVLFGGYRPGTNAMADTWEWDGFGWIRRTPTTSPPARSMHVMAYDEARGVTVLFGGVGSAWFNDTWEWDGDNWRQVVTANAPPAPLEQPAMAYHGGTNPGILLFGGLGATTYSSQTWQFNGANWTLRSTFGLSGRMAHAMAYAASTRRTYLHGGRTGNGLTNSELWAWDGNGWSWCPWTGPEWPDNLGYHSMAWDEAHNELVLVGGSNGSGGGSLGAGSEFTYYGLLSGPSNPLAVSWFAPWNWNATLGRFVPPSRINLATVYDRARRTVVSFGGQELSGSGVLGSHSDRLYEVPPGGVFFMPWVERWRIGGVGNPAPQARIYTEMAFDAGLGRSILFGGWSGGGVLGDTWSFDGTAWTNHGATSAPARLQPAMCYAPLVGGTAMFGGGGGFGGPYYSDLRVWNGTDWLQTLTTGTTPAARYGHDMVYDSHRNRIVLFGGYGAGGAIGTTHELRQGTFLLQWLQAPTTGAPPARNSHRMAYDARRQRTVMFGGSDAAGIFLGDTWEYDGATATWTQVFPAQSPPRRWNHVMEYDPARGVVVLSGGYGNPLCGNYCASHLNDVWEFDGVTWTQRQTDTTAPSGREGAGFAYDSARQRFVLQGGGAGTYPTETWLYNAPVHRMGQGMAINAFRVRCTKFPVAGQLTGFAFPSADGFGWLAAHPEPSPAPVITLGPGLFCDWGTVYAPPTILFDANGNPGTTAFVLPASMVGQGFVVQGIALQLAGFCLRVSDPLAVTVHAP